MNPERVIAGLDIGSAKTTVVIAEAMGDLHRQVTLKVMGVGQARTTGLRRGIVADIEETWAAWPVKKTLVVWVASERLGCAKPQASRRSLVWWCWTPMSPHEVALALLSRSDQPPFAIVA